MATLDKGVKDFTPERLPKGQAILGYLSDMFEKFRFHVSLIARYLLNRMLKRNFIPNQDIFAAVEKTSNVASRKTTIIIPTKDNEIELAMCVGSIQKHTKLQDYEIIVVNNGSVSEVARRYLSQLRASGVIVLDYTLPFNFSAICNLAAENASGELLVFINDDVQVLNDEWLEEMEGYAFIPQVGVVGALLTYPSGEVQHSGIVYGKGGLAGHLLFIPKDEREGSEGEGCYLASAVTFAAAAIEKSKYLAVGGMDEEFPVGLNDVDICLRLQNKDYRNVVCTRAKFSHVESSTRGKASSLYKFIRHYKDISRFVSIHGFPDEKYFVST